MGYAAARGSRDGLERPDASNNRRNVDVTVGKAHLCCAWRQRQALREVGHRPWPVPEGPWIMGQSWERLLFAHWPIEESRLRRFVPPQIPIDTFDGSAWIGVTPFLVGGLRLRFLPATARDGTLSGDQRPHLRHDRGSSGDLLLQPRCPQRPGDRGGSPRLPAAVLSLKDRRQTLCRRGQLSKPKGRSHGYPGGMRHRILGDRSRLRGERRVI